MDHADVWDLREALARSVDRESKETREVLVRVDRRVRMAYLDQAAHLDLLAHLVFLEAMEAPLEA